MALATPTAGRLSLFGEPPSALGRTMRERVGLVPQEDNLDPDLSVRQNLEVYGRYFGRPATELVERVRREIAAGTYDRPEVWEQALDRLLQRLDQEGLKPQAEADRYTLIRRLSLDLTGLPPTVEMLAQWEPKLKAASQTPAFSSGLAAFGCLS